MLKTLVIAALAAPLLAVPAFADEERLSNLEFSRANRCLALAGLDALKDDAVRLSSLEARFRATKESIDPDAKSEAESEARAIRALGRGADTPQEVARLKARRDRACSFFVDSTTQSAANP
jgi:hypothetical protein